MPGRTFVLGLPDRRAESMNAAVAGPAIPAVPAGVDPAAAADVGIALRVPAFVVVTLALGLGAHATAGGGLPSPESAVLIGILLAIAGRLFALREQSLPRLAAMVWSIQAGIHYIIMAGHQHGGASLEGLRLGGHHLHLAGGLPAGTSPPIGQLAAGGTGFAATADLSGQAAGAVAASADQGNSLVMLALHAVAGLAVAVWLRRGEAVVYRAARRILPRLLRHHTAPPILPTRLPILLITAPRPALHLLVLCLASPRRGPPVLAA